MGFSIHCICVLGMAVMSLSLVTDPNPTEPNAAFCDFPHQDLTKTMIIADHDNSKVTLVCGGVSGHEPGSTGFVGVCSPQICGDVFASPSARQVYGAMKAE